MTYRERMLYGAFKTLSLHASNYAIAPCISEEAKRLYKHVVESRQGRSNNCQALVACSIYMAFKRNGVPRSLREVNAMFGIQPVAMTKACKVFHEELEDDVSIFKTSEPRDFVARFCSKLDLDDVTTDACRRVLTVVEEQDMVVNCTPLSIVAGVILFCCIQYKITQVTTERIADVTHVTASTVKKSYRQLHPYLHMLRQVIDGHHRDKDDNEEEEEEEVDAVKKVPSGKKIHAVANINENI